MTARTVAHVAALCFLLAAPIFAGQTAPEPALPAEAQKAFDVGTTLYQQAVLSDKGEDWDAAVDALGRAYEQAPSYGPTMFYLASANQLRKLPLTAMAWGHSYLWTAPNGEFAAQAREIVEYSSRQAEQEKFRIIAAAKELAGRVPVGGMAMADRQGHYATDYYRPQHSGLDVSITDHRRGVLMDVGYAQAQAGDLEPFVAQMKALARHAEPNFSETLKTSARAYWGTFFEACLETNDWEGAMEALDWDYGSVDAPVSRRARFWYWYQALNVPEGSLDKAWGRLLDQFYGDESLASEEQIASAWARLATELREEERATRIGERVESLQKQAQNKRGNPESIPVEVAALAVPLGRALHRIRAVERAGDNLLLEGVHSKSPGFRAENLEKVKPHFHDHPRLFVARGYRDVTALHLAALGSMSPVPVFSRLDGFDAYFSRGGPSPSAGGWSVQEERKGIPSARAYVQFLLDKKADANARMTNGWTPLHIAAVGESGDAQAVEIARLLLARGAGADARTNRGLAPLHIAAWRGNTDLAAVLLAGGADANARSDDGQTPLHFAARRSSRLVLEFFISKGMDADAADEDGWTPLHVAARNGNVAAVTCLLAKGADVHAVTKIVKQTPLHMAAMARNGSVELLLPLLKAGADAGARDANGKTAAQLASENGNGDVSEFLNRR